MNRPALMLQRFVLRTRHGPLRPAWRLVYAVLARAYALWLWRGERDVSVYLKGGLAIGTPVYGLSDVDLAVVTCGGADAAARARERIVARHDRLRGLVPWLAEKVLDAPVVVEQRDLATADTPVQTYGLGAQNPDGRALYFGSRAYYERVGLHERPGLYGPTADWRRLRGAECLPAAASPDRDQLRLTAWLELQSWWRWFLQACGHPPGPRSAHLCVKAVAEPVRIWLWLAHGQRCDSRREALERGLRVFPEEEDGLRRALALEVGLAHNPRPPMGETLATLVALTERIAALLEEEIAPAGTTTVELRWGGREELLLPRNSTFRLAPVVADHRAAVLLPLADWRALARTSLRSRDMTTPAPPDETIAPLKLDPAALDDLTAALGAGDDGPYPALRRGRVLVLASRRWPRTQLRGVHGRLDSPVAFAILDGSGSAGFPNVPGWSAHDTARRAIAEHAAWLAHAGPPLSPGDALGMLITAARAALFHESVVEGRPELAVTCAATLDAMRARGVGRPDAINDAHDGYRRFVVDGTVPASSVIASLRDAVTAMDAYAERAGSDSSEASRLVR